ncbi:hypothetical protein ACRTDO_22320 [Vibrio furnissii]|uniref:hypothetical protein n=1 Tax=Vibrio furnissii TaxID=29494 RepID=UPI003D7CD731
MAEFQSWTNENSGFLSFIIFLLTLLVSFVVWLIKRKVSKSKNKALKVEVDENVSICSSFDTGNIQNNFRLHRTVLMLYVKITNIGDVPICMGNIQVGYKSQSLEDPEEWYWLKDETTMLEDYKAEFGESIKVYPFLKQKNMLMENQVNLLIHPGEYRNGIVYFEQTESDGNKIPYMDSDYRVGVNLVVKDTLGHAWNTEARIYKVLIEAIRKLNPTFGLSRQSCEKRA